MASDRPLWRCERCGRSFANRNQVHTCRELGSIDDRRMAMTSTVRDIFDEFVSVVRSNGPVEILVERTRIAFHVRMSFAALMPRDDWMNGHLVLAERVDDEHFHRVTTFSRRNHLHEFKFSSTEDLDSEMRGWIGAAYQVGMQRHL